MESQFRSALSHMPERHEDAIPPERLFCPKCGQATAYDCSGEGDWTCRNEACSHYFNGPHPNPFISPLRERDLHAAELVRLTLENERLRAALAKLEATHG